MQVLCFLCLRFSFFLDARGQHLLQGIVRVDACMQPELSARLPNRLNQLKVFNLTRNIMKLHLPTSLRAALLAVVAAGSAAYGSTTYDDLTTPDYFKSNEHVYNTGKGTFYLETPSCDLNLTLTLNLNKLNDFQTVHDYANGGYYSPFVTWTYNNNPGANYGMADVARGYSGVNYDSGFTGYWAGKPWTTGTKITTDTLWGDYADTDGNVTLTINNTPNGTTNNVVVTATNKSGTVQTLYSGNGLRSQSYTSQHITSFTVNMNYVTSVTLNTGSVLDSSSFTPPKDYTVPFESKRTDGTSVGRILFLGDSITHGVQDMSYRWGIFKTLVDNGIENELAGPLSGYHSDPLNGDYNGNYSSSQYGGEKFDNAHYAQSSGRTHNMLTAGGSVNALGNSTGVNYGGVSSAKVGNDYNADTYVMMMGTNDILSDGAYNDTNMPKVTERLLGVGEVQNGKWVNGDVTSALIGAQGTDPATAAFSGKWGTMGQIIDNMQMDAGDTMYIVSIPTWGEGRTGLNGAAPYVADYNVKLEKWVDAYNASHTGTVKYVDVNRGLVNVTRNGQFLAPDAFFRTTGTDYIHPNEQGALIVAGNLARGMGLAGRTAGLARSAAGAAGWTALEPTISLAAGASQQLLSNVFTEDGGYTIDFGAVFGNGATGGWLDRNNALSVSVGDGINTGTLNISEGYISWGDKLLFCQDNSQAGNENIRVAFHNGNEEQNVAAGYYVWLGDMLIGQGLASQSGNLLNGVTVNSVGSSSTLTGFSWANTAYAPTTTYTAGTPYLVTQKAGNTELVSTAPMLPPMENHNSTATHLEDVSFSGEASASGQYATVGQAASGAISVIRTGTSTDGWIGAVGADHTGNVDVNFHDLQTSSTLILSVVSKSVTDGRVSVVLDGGTVINKDGHFDSSGDHSFLGVYRGNVGGVLQLEVNDATLKSGILMGHASGTGTISGGTKLIVNEGASIGGDVFGGSSSAGSKIQGGTSIAITGGTINGSVYGGNLGGGSITGGTEIVITGGTITGDVVGGNKAGSAGTVEGGTVVTVDGNKALIGGNISGDTVNLKNVAQTEYSDSFDKYKGTITANTVVLDNYTADAMGATLKNGVNLTVKNGTDTALTQNAAIGTMNVEAGTKIAFDGGKHTVTNLFADDKSAAKSEVTLKNNAQVSATNLRVGAQGETYSVQDGSSLSITGNNIKIEAAAEGGAAGLSTNRGPVNGYYTYALGSDVFVLDDAKVTISNATAELKNKLSNSAVVVNKEGSTITVSNGGNTLTALTAQQGNLVVTNAANSKTALKEISAAGGNVDIRDLGEGASVSLQDLLIGNSRAVTALVSGTSVAADESNVAKVVVTGELNAMTGAKLNANLTMASGSTLKVADGGLELGCTLTLNKGINLGDEQLSTLYDTHYVELFSGVDAITLASADITNSAEAITLAQGIDAGLFFNLPTAADVTAPNPVRLIYTGAGNGGVVALTIIPEPATATLSLLALAALAARRRRK